MEYKGFVKTLYEGEIIDTRYPLKGTFIWPPYGTELKERVFQMVCETFSKNGYQKYQFPRLIPREMIRPVTENIQNFEHGLFWLYTKMSDSKEDFCDMFLNPTSESSVNWMLRRWLRDGKKLPIKMFQVGSTYRPHERPQPLVNADEFFNLAEAYGIYSSREEALTELDNVLGFLEETHLRLGIPYKLLKRPIWGNKPVAEFMYSFETFLPYMNRSFNVGVAYYQGQIFSKAFGTKFKKKEGGKDYTYQNTFGLSERCISAMLALHSDKYGLCLLPEFAPIQVTVIPFRKDKGMVDYVENVKNQLDGLRVTIDERYNKTILKRLKKHMKTGVPIRVGIRDTDIQNDTVTFSRRDLLEVVKDLPLAGLRYEIDRSLPEIYTNLYKRAKQTLDSHIVTVNSVDRLSSATTSFKIGRFNWCDSEECGKYIEEKLEGEILGSSLDEAAESECINCGEKATSIAYFAKRAYSP